MCLLLLYRCRVRDFISAASTHQDINFFFLKIYTSTMTPFLQSSNTEGKTMSLAVSSLSTLQYIALVRLLSFLLLDYLIHVLSKIKA